MHYLLCFISYMSYLSLFHNSGHEGMPFMTFVMTFVRRSLYPWGDNVSMDEGH
jgi:hypothetical protein